MARRLNLYGFSLPQMRRLCGSRDEAAVGRLRDRIATDLSDTPGERRGQLVGVVERAVFEGAPFTDLQAETSLHALAAGLLAAHGQEWLVTRANVFGASALEEGLWGQYRRHASPEAQAFLRGLVEGVPLFGRQPPADGSAYAAVGLDSLRVFLPHLRDVAEVIAYRVGRKRAATEEDRAGAEFAAEFCGWVDEIVAAGRDVWFQCG
ncbi:MAG TPA: hypothetical protein VH092_24025 [Urbifossiella sp.]|jgi:hypothetical protein|nr:hypothetical protein [Urbifossiella sp.]